MTISENQKIEETFVDTLLNKDNLDAANEIAEIALDEICKDYIDDLAKEIPILKTVKAFFKTSFAIKEYFFMKKLLLFVQGVNKADLEIKYKINQANFKNKQKKELGETILICLEKITQIKKLSMLAKVFTAYVCEEINHEEFHRFVFAIENMDINNLKYLVYFYIRVLYNCILLKENEFVYAKDIENVEDTISPFNSSKDKKYLLQNFISLGFISLNFKDYVDNKINHSSENIVKALESALGGHGSYSNFNKNNFDSFAGLSSNDSGSKFLEILEIIKVSH